MGSQIKRLCELKNGAQHSSESVKAARPTSELHAAPGGPSMPTDGFIVLGPRSVSSGPNIDHPFLTRAVSACRPASASRHVAVYSRQQARTHVYHFLSEPMAV